MPSARTGVCLTLKTNSTMVHFGKTQDDELQIIVTEQDIRNLQQMISGADLMRRRQFFDLKNYIENNYQELLTQPKHQQQ